MGCEKHNSEVLAELWGDFVGWNERIQGIDLEFLTRQLIGQIRERILDASMGDGVDSISLLKKGFRVTSNEIDEAYIRKALENSRRQGVALDLTEYDWLDIDNHFSPDSFGGIICMGNSLTYLFNRDDQLKALQNFRSILKSDSQLIIDERNYQYFLDEREEILEGNFRYSGNIIYHGRKVHARPIEITDDLVVMEYEHAETGYKGYLHLYPFKKNELLGLLEETGFSDIKQYSDYEPGYNPEADFHQYVCKK
jgi:SAM-dependent methyltransferase